MSESVTDEQLFRRFLAQREESALGELALRYEQRMLGLARGMMGGDRSRAMDAVQETWMRIIRYGATFNGKASFGTWAYRILVNECRRLSDRERRGAVRIERKIDESPTESHEIAAFERAGPDSMRTLIAELTPAKRDVLLLCYHRGMTQTQAAEVLDIPLGTLKSRLSAALEELRSKLSEKGES